ncbi:MAG: M15 family metallopeptidase [Bacteroidota bacterium]
MNLSAQQDSLDHYGFVYLDQELSHANFDLRYAYRNNFLGRPVSGYGAPHVAITRQAASQITLIEEELNTMGYHLKIFDAYRPQRAVNEFRVWASDLSDTLTKHQYYPEVNKQDLFRLGYIATRSGHSRGSTIDLTICYNHTGAEVDMGGPFDFFGELSHHSFNQITEHQKANRMMLKSIMMKYGFKPYAKEWWHYTLREEPHPNRYFDFVVE